jgi:hypothetical protein
MVAVLAFNWSAGYPVLARLRTLSRHCRHVIHFDFLTALRTIRVVRHFDFFSPLGNSIMRRQLPVMS